MASTKQAPERHDFGQFRQRLARGALGLLALAGIVWLALQLRRPPQMGSSEEAFRTVDALFTAIAGKSHGRLAQCERRLRTLHEKGELPDSAARTLTAIIDEAKAGNWQPAGTQLYAFMLAQRREGPIEHEKKGQKKPNSTVASVR